MAKNFSRLSSDYLSDVTLWLKDNDNLMVDLTWFLIAVDSLTKKYKIQMQFTEENVLKKQIRRYDHYLNILDQAAKLIVILSLFCNAGNTSPFEGCVQVTNSQKR